MYRTTNQFFVIAILIGGASVPAFAQNTTFTYQGLLKDSGSNLTGQVDLEFLLSDADTTGAQIGGTLAVYDVDVIDGLFTVDLDFGASALNGGDRWLEIAVANPAGGAFITLSPRQPLTASPYALQTRGIAVDDVGNVGIGTDTPASLLHVDGSARAGNFVVHNPNNASASVKLDWHNDIARIRYGGNGNGAQNGFSIQGTGDSVKLRLLDNGALGLGTSNPGGVFNSKLDVIGGHIAVSNNYGFFSFNSTNNGIGAGLDTTTGDNLELYAGGSSRMTVESTGDVGIGTTNPVTKLDVRGRLVLDDSAGSLIYTAASGPEQSKYLRLINSPDLGSASGLKAGGVLVSDDYNYANPGKLDLIVKGAVGVGTASPAARLAVVESGGSGSAANFLCNDVAGSGDCMVSRVVGSGIAGNFAAEGAGQAILATHSLVDSTVVRLERTADSNSNIDLLELRTGAASQDNMQFIECERGSDVKFRVWGDGDVTADGTYTGPADFAEMIRVAGGGIDTAEAGDVMVIDPTEDRAVRVSASARSTLVAGIYSAKPGYLGSENDWDEVALQLVGSDPVNPEELVAAKPIDLGRMIGQIPLAVVGIVPCKVSAENGPIKPGDLLVTSGTPGHAMREKNARAGTIVGKALGSQSQGTGVIKVLVTLQ